MKKINLNPTIRNIIKKDLLKININKEVYYSDSYSFFKYGFNKTVDKKINDNMDIKGKLHFNFKEIEDITYKDIKTESTFLKSNNFNIYIKTEYYLFYEKYIKKGYKLKILDNKVCSTPLLLLLDKDDKIVCGSLGLRYDIVDKTFNEELTIQEYENELEKEKNDCLGIIDKMYLQYKEYMENDIKNYTLYKDIIKDYTVNDFKFMNDGVYFDYISCDKNGKLIENVPLFSKMISWGIKDNSLGYKFWKLNKKYKKILYNKIIDLYIK